METNWKSLYVFENGEQDNQRHLIQFFFKGGGRRRGGFGRYEPALPGRRKVPSGAGARQRPAAAADRRPGPRRRRRLFGAEDADVGRRRSQDPRLDDARPRRQRHRPRRHRRRPARRSRRLRRIDLKRRPLSNGARSQIEEFGTDVGRSAHFDWSIGLAVEKRWL